MATSTKTTKAKPRAAAAKRAPAKRRAPAVKPVAAKAGGSDLSLRGLAKALEEIKLSGLAGKLVQGWRKDLEAIVGSNQKSYRGLQAVVEHQTSKLKDAIAEWQSVAKVMSVAGPRESIGQLDELAKQSFKMALENIRELAELAAKSQADAFDLTKQRILDRINEVNQLLRRD